MKKLSKKRLAAIFLTAAFATTLVTCLALFTDREQSQTEYTAGTLDIVLGQEWISDNAETAKNFTPGDKLLLSYSLENKGNLDAKVKETFVVTTDKAVTNEFEIYAASDVEKDSTSGLWVVKASASPIKVRTSEAYGTGTKITYEIPQFVLDATGKKTFDLVLLFNKDSKNSVKGTNITVEYIAQALQDRNTGDETWEDAKVITEKITIGGTEKNVVPKLN